MVFKKLFRWCKSRRIYTVPHDRLLIYDTFWTNVKIVLWLRSTESECTIMFINIISLWGIWEVCLSFKYLSGSIEVKRVQQKKKPMKNHVEYIPKSTTERGFLWQIFWLCIWIMIISFQLKWGHHDVQREVKHDGAIGRFVIDLSIQAAASSEKWSP